MSRSTVWRSPRSVTTKCGPTTTKETKRGSVLCFILPFEIAPYTLMIRESLNCRDVSLKRQSTSISCFFEGCHIVFCFFVLKVVDWLDYNLLFYSILLSNVSWRTRKKWVKKSEQSVFAFFLVKLFYLHNTLATENNCCLNSKYGNRITSCFHLNLLPILLEFSIDGPSISRIVPDAFPAACHTTWPNFERTEFTSWLINPLIYFLVYSR